MGQGGSPTTLNASKEMIVNSKVAKMPSSVNERQKECNITSDYKGPTLEFHAKQRSLVGQSNRLANSDHGIYLRTSYRCNDISLPFNILIDCGASMSLLHHSLLEKIPEEYRIPLQETNLKVRFADGRVQSGTGVLKLPVWIGKEVKIVDFLVGEFTDDAILGMRDLKAFGISIDFDNCLVTKGDLWLPAVDVNSKPLVNKVVIRRTCVLAPRSQSIVQACVKQRKGQVLDNESTVMMIPTNSITNELGVLPAKTLHFACKKIVPILMYNPSTEPVVLEPDTVVGLMESVHELSIEESIANTESVSKHCEVLNKVKSIDTKDDFPAHLEDLYKRSVVNLSSEECLSVRKFLKENADVYSKHEYDLGRTNVIEHELPIDSSNQIMKCAVQNDP